LVALGNKQEYSLDYEETFVPVAKITTVRTILAITTSKAWPLHQIDVKNAFLNGDLKEEIYMKPPLGMSTTASDKVCKLRRSLYRLIFWKCKKYDCVSKSFMEAEYKAMSATCSKIIWLRGLISELGFPPTDLTPFHGDNTSVIQITANSV